MQPATRIGVVAVAALALLPAASAGTSGSGLYGVVKKGPISPVCRTGVPCDVPAQVVLTFSSLPANRSQMQTGQVQLKSDEHGRYRVALDSGYYTVTTGRTQATSRPIRPRAVHVRAGHWDRINFLVDTGIR